MRIASDSKSVRHTRVVYVLYFIGAIFWPVMIVGVIFAYVLRYKVSNSFVLSHLRKQIQIFWICFVIAIGGGIALVIVVFSVVLFTLAGVAVTETFPDAAIFVMFFSIVLLAILHGLGLLIYVFVATTKGLMTLNDDEPIQHGSNLFGFGERRSEF